MRQLMFIIFLIADLLTVDVISPSPSTITISKKQKPLTVYDLSEAVRMVESGGADSVVGALGEIGPFQIRQCRLTDFNQKTGSSYLLNEMFDREKARIVFMFYTNGKSFQEISRTWNGGFMGMHKKSTEKYWMLVQKRLSCIRTDTVYTTQNNGY